MTKTIEFDTGLNLDELRHDLREAEKEVERLSKKLKRQIATRDYYYEKQREAEELFGENSKEAKSYLTKWLNASDAVDRTTAELEEAQEKQRMLSENVEEATVETTKWQDAMAGVSEVMDGIKKRIKGLIKNVLFFSVITKLLRSISSYITNAIKQNEEVNLAVQRLKASLEALITPLVNALVPALVAVFTWLTRIITALATLIGRMFPKAIKATKKFAQTAGGGNMLAGFDTIMTLGGGGSSSEAENNLAIMQMTNEEIARILMGVGLIASGLLAWKIPVSVAGFWADWLVWLTLIATIILQIYNFLKMWQDGIDLSNLAGVLVGIAGTAFLLRKMFGPTAQGIALLVSGITLLFTAIKDTTENGQNLANTLGVIGGIIATGLGIATLTKNLQVLTVAGVIALLYALASLGGQGVEFINAVKTAFGGLIDFIMGVFTGDWERAWNGIKQVFKGICNGILSVFGGVVNALVRGINWIGSKINGIGFNLPDFLGGGRIGFYVPPVQEWTVPYLAQGAVIPPNREFMAVLGDQRSGTNIETPLETMIEAFRQAQSEQSINITFNGDLASLASILRPQIAQQNKRRGL